MRGEEPIRPYYTPRDRAGNHINILKVRPKPTSPLHRLRPVRGAVPDGLDRPGAPGGGARHLHQVLRVREEVPAGAKYFDDPGYLYHQHELEEQYARRAQNEQFI